MVFLHGPGERGTDIEKIKVHGPPMLVEQGKQFPFIIVSPQAGANGWEPTLLKCMIQKVVETEAVDTNRIYLTGLSMGGCGTWRLAMDNPGMFAAIVPICGGGNPADVWKLRHMPTWVFHGAKDGIVPLSASESMVKPLQKINDQVKFTVYPETYHDSWIQAYNDPKLYEWLLQQKRFLFKPIALSEDALMEYVGIYNMQLDGTEIRVACDFVEGKLQLLVNENKIPLQAYEPDRFFVDSKMQLEFHFHRDAQGKVTEASMFQNTVYTLKKVSQ